MKTTAKQKLVQTQVPVSVLAAIEKRAKRGGLSVAATVRQILLRETGLDGAGESAEASAEEVSYEAKGVKTISFPAPHPMRVDAVTFEGDHLVSHIFVGAKTVLHANEGGFRPGDFPHNRVPIRYNCPAGLAITVQFVDGVKLESRIRIIGTRFGGDQLPAIGGDRSASLALVLRGAAVARGRTTEAVVFPQETFRGELLVSSSVGWKVETIEIARRRVHEAFNLKQRQEVDLPSAPCSHEIRVVVRNLDKKKRPFEARLYGSTVD